MLEYRLGVMKYLLYIETYHLITVNGADKVRAVQSLKADISVSLIPLHNDSRHAKFFLRSTK
jgi:type IV secretory pathway VirB6-like protein